MRPRLGPALAILLVASIGTPAPAGISTNAGTSTAQFLKLDMGARHAAMGGTYSGYGADVFTLWGQPSALADAPAAWQVGAQHTEWFEGIDQQFVGIAGPLGSGRFGVTVNTVGVDGLARTTESATGAFAGSGGVFGARDIAAGIHYGRKLGDRLGAGIALKYIGSEIDNVTASSYAVDIGARVTFARLPGLTVGGSITNLGPGLRFIRLRDDLPTAGRVGATYDFSATTSVPVLVSADVVKYNDREWDVGAGLEWRPISFLGLRAGYRTQGDDVGEGLTAGLGVKFGGLSFDYAYVPFGDLGDAHRISGGYLFGGGHADDSFDGSAPGVFGDQGIPTPMRDSF